VFQLNEKESSSPTSLKFDSEKKNSKTNFRKIFFQQGNLVLFSYDEFSKWFNSGFGIFPIYFGIPKKFLKLFSLSFLNVFQQQKYSSKKT